MLFPLPTKTSRPRVVITGIGIVTAYGVGWKANARGFRNGDARFRPVTLFDVSRQRVKIAAAAEFPAELPASGLSKRQSARMERSSRLLLWATSEALNQARWSDKSRVPLVLGTTSGGMSMGEAFFRAATRAPFSRKHQPTHVTRYLAQRQALDAVEACGLGGPIHIIANACAAGANAIGHAWDMLRANRCERILAGGYDALAQLVFAGFDSLQALSPTICRPFDAARDGLALGDGAAVLALETLESAKNRGAEILAEIVGYGACTDAHHLTQPHPEGEAALESMRMACHVAKVQPEEIAYINAHGTGTPLNDSAETHAINAWAGDAAKNVWVSSTKAGIGHLLGAAGAVESAACIISLVEQWLPPMRSTEKPDPSVQFRLVQQAAEGAVWKGDYQYALSNSFGFGGANASLLFRRWH